MEPADKDHPSDTPQGLKGAGQGPVTVTEDGSPSADSTPVPPYWSHRRYESYCSVGNTKPAPITLEDHTGELGPESNPTWAKGVMVHDYVLVAGSVPSIGNFVVWNCTIDTLDVSIILNTRHPSRGHHPHQHVHSHPFRADL